MSTKIPGDLKYTKEHEWAKIEGDIVTIGITDFAQSALGDIVFAEVPEVGKTLKSGEAFGVVESIKSVSDLYSPLSGTVIEKNSNVETNPEKINENAFEAWLIKLKISNPNEIQGLLSAESYTEFCNSSH
jgi:glycine cleavage system H protein